MCESLVLSHCLVCLLISLSHWCMETFLFYKHLLKSIVEELRNYVFRRGSNRTVVSLLVNNMAEIFPKKRLTKTFPCERDSHSQWLSQSFLINVSTIPMFYNLQGKRNATDLPSLALKLWYPLISAQPRVQKEKLLSWKCTEVTWCVSVGHN